MREPSKTVKTGAIAGAVTILLIWAVNLAWPTLEIPPAVSAAFTLIVAQIGAWIVRDPQKGAKH